MTGNLYEKDLTWRARYRTFSHAGRGIAVLLATQWNARIHVLAAAGVVAAGFFFGLTSIEWCAIVFAIALVWITEALNTAIEFTVDLASPQVHPLAGKAKDIAAGAVLSSAIFSSIIGALVFLPRICEWVGSR